MMDGLFSLFGIVLLRIFHLLCGLGVGFWVSLIVLVFVVTLLYLSVWLVGVCVSMLFVVVIFVMGIFHCVAVVVFRCSCAFVFICKLSLRCFFVVEWLVKVVIFLVMDVLNFLILLLCVGD